MFQFFLVLFLFFCFAALYEVLGFAWQLWMLGIFWAVFLVLVVLTIAVIFVCLGLQTACQNEDCSIVYLPLVWLINLPHRAWQIYQIQEQEALEAKKLAKQQQELEWAQSLLEFSPIECLEQGTIGNLSEYFELVGNLLAYHLKLVDIYQQLKVLRKFLEEVGQLYQNDQDLYASILKQEYYNKIKAQYLALKPSESKGEL